MRHAFGPIPQQGEIGHTVAFPEFAVHEKVGVHVDAVLLQGGEQVIQLVQGSLGEGLGVLRRGIEQVGGGPGCVHVVQADQVDAQSGHAFGNGLGPFMGRERVGAHQVGAPETDGGTVGKDMTPPLHGREPVVPGWGFIERRKVQGRGVRALPRHEGLPIALVGFLFRDELGRQAFSRGVQQVDGQVVEPCPARAMG